MSEASVSQTGDVIPDRCRRCGMPLIEVTCRVCGANHRSEDEK